MDSLSLFPFEPPRLDAICDLPAGDALDEELMDMIASRGGFAGLCEAEACWGVDELRYPLGFHTAGRCRRCGCTERRACRDGGRACSWVDAPRYTLCSRCARFPGRRRFRRPRRAVIVAGLLGWYWTWRRRVRHLTEARDRRRWKIADGVPLTICGDPAAMDPATVEALASLVETVNAAAARGEFLARAEHQAPSLARYQEDDWIATVEILADRSTPALEAYQLRVVATTQQSCFYKPVPDGSIFECSRRRDVGGIFTLERL